MSFPYVFSIDFHDDEGNASASARSLKQLLPQGPVWNLDPDSNVSRFLVASADELDRVQARAADLVEESDPRTATETLPDWERVIALPDAAIQSIPATNAARRLAITQKFTSVGGQTPAYFVSVAAACGYTATVSDAYGSQVLRSGFRSGARCYDTQWAYVWSMTVQPPAGPALTHAELEAVIRRAAPAHTIVFFTYL